MTSPLALLTVGRTYAGKTTFARSAASRLPAAVLLDSSIVDEFLRHSFSAIELAERNRPSVRFDDRTLADAIFADILEFAVRSRVVPVLSNAHLTAAERRPVIDRLHQLDARVAIVHFDHSDEFLIRRIRSADRNRSVRVGAGERSADEVLLERQAQLLEPPTAQEADELIRVDDATRPAELLERVSALVAGGAR